MTRPASPVWAKWRDGSPYPLVAHLLDTAAFASALCDGWLAPRLLGRLAEMLDGTVEEAVKTVVSAAALHDVGKANPVFAAQLLSPEHRLFAGQVEALRAAGLRLDPSPVVTQFTSEEKRWVRRHEICSAVLLAGGFDERIADGLAAVVGGHHGRWAIPDWDVSPGPQAFYNWLTSDQAWSAHHHRTVELLVDVVGIDPEARVADPAAVPLLTGLVCLADWLASDLADREDPPPDDANWIAYFRGRCAESPARIARMLGTPSRPSGTFADVFGFPPSRPIQEHLTAAGSAGLRVVMVPTGDGKTEAALGHWIRNAGHRQGLLFALPTMATADAMLPRIRKLFDAADERTLGAFRHGRSLLNEFYDLPDQDLRGEHHDSDGDGAGGLVPGEWFHGRHRALFAPIAITTADQVLLGVLRHRYNFMRLVGASTKTIVFDEVHSYDPYMARLLEKFLRWAAELHVDVVLLSATLPVVQLEAYLDAYTGDHSHDEDGTAQYPAVVTAHPGSPPSVTPLDATGDRRRVVEIVYERAPDPADAIEATVTRLRASHPDAKIGVIANTVGRCQQVAERLIVDGLRPEVMHSRFPASLRADHVEGATVRYGNRSMSGAALLVATQVVEQSVDLDFDVLVTDLCPAPSLLQRLGRLHRHDHDPQRRARPAGLTDPIVHVVVPDPLPVDQLGAFLPYPAAQVLATWEDALLHGDRDRILIPGDVQGLVDAAHVTLEQMRQRHRGAVDRHLLDRAVQSEQARRRAIPDPASMRRDHARGLTDFTSGDLDESHFETRWSEQERADVLLVGSQPHTWNGPLPSDPDRETLRKLLGCVVSLSGSTARAVTGVCDPPDRLPAGWQKGLLRSVEILNLDTTERWELDPTLGLKKKEPT